MVGNPIRQVAVLDVGKTHVKVALVDRSANREVEIRRTANEVRGDGPYPHYDVERVWRFFLESLADLNRSFGVDGIAVTTHGASGALLGDDDLALPVLDYEDDGPDGLAKQYDATRPDFSETYSPRLPNGLNLGAQIFWQQKAFPEAFAKVRSIVTYPEYWIWRLTGRRAVEMTSLGCHTDLWQPEGARFSSMVARLGWQSLMPEAWRAGRVRIPLESGLANEIGLTGSIPVVSGIHDSNASLVPYLGLPEPRISVLSTGTWCITFTIGGDLSHLDPHRDCLANVCAQGDPVASSRFMGGREFEILCKDIDSDAVSDIDDAALAMLPLVTPPVVAECGPFPKTVRRGAPELSGLTPERIYAAASLYLGMMSAECLDLTGGTGKIFVEGAFARNELFGQTLAAITDQDVVLAQGSAAGTTLGAAMLFSENLSAGGTVASQEPVILPPKRRDIIQDRYRQWRSGLPH